MNNQLPDYYEALGVSRSATTEDVRKAYKQKLLETHPDKLGPDASEEEKQEAEEMFRKVREAFEILGDIDQRRAYDIHQRNLPTPGSYRWRMQEEKLRRARDRATHRAQESSDADVRSIQQTTQTQETVVQHNEAADYASLVDSMLQELYNLTPEWVERRQRIQMLKAARAQSATNSGDQNKVKASAS